MTAERHDGGVQTHRDGRTRLASAWGLCDCGWRGPRHYGEDAGMAASADGDTHYSANVRRPEPTARRCDTRSPSAATLNLPIEEVGVSLRRLVQDGST